MPVVLLVLLAIGVFTWWLRDITTPDPEEITVNTEGLSRSLGLASVFREPRNLPAGARPSSTLAAVMVYAPLYGVPPEWIYWTAYLESKFRPGLIGDHGKAFGLTQLWTITAETVKENGYQLDSDWQFGVSGNIRTACQYAQWLIRNFDIREPGEFREYWVLGPGSYGSGEREPREAQALRSALAGAYL